MKITVRRQCLHVHGHIRWTNFPFPSWIFQFYVHFGFDFLRCYIFESLLFLIPLKPFHRDENIKITKSGAVRFPGSPPPPSVPGLHLACPEVVDTRRCGNRLQHGSSHNPRNSERYCSNLSQYISFWQYIFFRNHLPWKKRYVILLVSRKKDLRSVWKVLTIKLREWESRQKELLWTETKEARQANSISLISYVKLFVNVLFQLQTSIYCLYDCAYSGVSVDSCSQFQ